MVLTHVLTVSKGYSYTLSLLALLVHSRVPTRNTFCACIAQVYNFGFLSMAAWFSWFNPCHTAGTVDNMQGYPLTKARVFVQLSRCCVVGDYGYRVSGFCPCRFRQSHNTTVEFWPDFAGTPTGALYAYIKVQIRKMWCVKPARRTKYGAV